MILGLIGAGLGVYLGHRLIEPLPVLVKGKDSYEKKQYWVSKAETDYVTGRRERTGERPGSSEDGVTRRYCDYARATNGFPARDATQARKLGWD